MTTNKNKLVCKVTETEMYLELDGVIIAKRGQPGSGQAETWVILEPGIEVTNGRDRKSRLVRRYGVRVH